MADKLLLIDGSSILKKAFYALPDHINEEGRHTGAVYGFLNLLLKMLQGYEPVAVTVLFETEEVQNHSIQMPEGLVEQFALIRDVLDELQIHRYEQEDVSAADLIGTFAQQATQKGAEAVVLTGRPHLLQLISDSCRVILVKTTGGVADSQVYTRENVLAQYQMEPADVIQLLAFVPDEDMPLPVNNLIGTGTAAKLLKEYGSVADIYGHLDNDIESVRLKESLRSSEEAVYKRLEALKIRTDVSTEIDIMKTGMLQDITEKIPEILHDLGYRKSAGKMKKVTSQKKAHAEAAIHETSDLAQVEEIFANAEKMTEKAENSFIGFAIIEDGKDSKNLIGLALAFDEKETFFIHAEGLITPAYLGSRLQEISKKGRLSTFNIKNTYHLFTPYEIDHPQEKEAGNFDTLIAAYLLNPLKNDYTIADITAEYLDLTIRSREQLFDKKKFSECDTELVANYAAEMARVNYMLAPILEQKLREQEMLQLMNQIEMPLTYVLYDMERVGIIVRKDELKEYGDKLIVRIQELEQHIHQEAGSDFNINSPKQLGEVLFEQMQIPGGRKTKSGYSTAADVLEKLAPDYAFVADILEYRGLTKLKSTYADGLADYIGADQRIHTTYHQTITATGRISSTDPNLQNIPMRTELGRLIRKVFVPQEGYLFTDADYSQIELRILAHMSEDKELISAYQEGRDIHRITASKVFHTPFDEVTSLQRRNAKAVNFGIVYGISAFGLSNDLNISRTEAKEYMDQYLATYPGVRKYQDQAVAKAKECGYAITLFGRRRPMPELKAGNFMQRQFGERVAMNAPIQGTAADIMKIGMIRVWRRIRSEHLRSRLILQIHDELVVETAPEEKQIIEDILVQEMTHAADLAVVLDVDCHSGSDWFDAKG